MVLVHFSAIDNASVMTLVTVVAALPPDRRIRGCVASQTLGDAVLALFDPVDVGPVLVWSRERLEARRPRDWWDWITQE